MYPANDEIVLFEATGIEPFGAHFAVHDRQVALETEVPDLLTRDGHHRLQPLRYRMDLRIRHSIATNYVHPITEVMCRRRIELAILGVPHQAMAIDVEPDSRLQVFESGYAYRTFGSLQGIDDIEYIGRSHTQKRSLVPAI